MKSTRLFPVLAAVALFATACSKSDHAGHDHDKKTASTAHAHTAPHGGTLVEIGDHAYNVELLRDAATGKLTAWILDAHAENFIRLKAPALELVAMPGGKFTPLTLAAVANPATNEKVGDTSQFEAQADWLKTTGSFAGIFTVEINGTVYKDVAYALGTADGHAHGSGDKTKKKPKPHDSPRGGTLVEIGEHEFNVDLVLDRATGKLHGWLLNAHAKGVTDVAKTTMKSFEAIVTVQGKKQTLIFRPVPPTDGSAFDAQADWLKSATEFDGTFPRLVIDGETFTGTTFNFPKGRTHP
jgi:hypothetical protein